MYCNKCGNKIEGQMNFCNKCGNVLNNPFTPSPPKPMRMPQKNNKALVIVSVVIFCFLLIAITITFVTLNVDEYFFPNNPYEDPTITNQPPSNQNPPQNAKRNPNRTVIKVDNIYEKVQINGVLDAYNIIKEDSVNQKNQCPQEILAIENKVINQYNITAVNLCEMEVSFAEEIYSAIAFIYDNFPDARKHLTNLSLFNPSAFDNTMIAGFLSAFKFATSDTPNDLPMVLKTQIFLNSSYFLNKDKLNSIMQANSKAGHFPPNVTTSSSVIHEFGHYLSFIATLNYYNVDSIIIANVTNMNSILDVLNNFTEGKLALKMLNEAYENYKRDTGSTIGFDDWRKTISAYAVAKDKDGNYIYDETLAEAFHDYYLNKNNAKPATKYIITVWKKYLGVN